MKGNITFKKMMGNGSSLAHYIARQFSMGGEHENAISLEIIQFLCTKTESERNAKVVD